MEKFKPRNEEEWRIQRDWLDNHIKAGASVVVDKHDAVVRVEYDNPIYHFYKANYERREVLLAALGFAVDDLVSLSDSGEIPEIPPEIKTIKARLYKEVGIPAPQEK